MVLLIKSIDCNSSNLNEEFYNKIKNLQYYSLQKKEKRKIKKFDPLKVLALNKEINEIKKSKQVKEVKEIRLIKEVKEIN